MTIVETPITKKYGWTFTKGDDGQIQTITIDDQVIRADELELLPERLRKNPKAQEQMRRAFGIRRHRKETIFRRVSGVIHSLFN